MPCGEKCRRDLARSGHRRDERLAKGIPMPEDTWNGILEGARTAGLDQAAIDRALAATEA